MRNNVIWSLLSLAALAVGGLAAGCDSDAKIARSAEGESCTKTSDCEDNLRCKAAVCVSSGSDVSNGEGGEGNGASGGPSVGPAPQTLGGPGESCGKRADCQEGLACLSSRCTAEGGGEGGGSSGPTLGGLGETCGLTSDCQTGFACFRGGVRGEGLLSGGVCTPLDSGLKPTGTVCGAECVTAVDCCELPIVQQAVLGAYSCSDLADLLTGVTCASAIGVNGERCLAYASYCDDQCGKTTWACNGGSCEYTAKCTKATAQQVGGCPAYTRGGRAIPTCDTKTSRCATAVPEGCTTDASCFAPTPQVIVGGGGDLCSDGECACYKPNGGCYRKCSEDQDCPVGYSCDEKSALCLPLSMCTTDAQCIERAGDSRVKCVDGTCSEPPCEHDIDCNPGGLIDGNFSRVCGPDKTCVALGCSDDAECGYYTGSGLYPTYSGVRAFCAPAVTTEISAAPISAVTD